MEECKGCKFDKVVNNEQEFFEQMDNCSECCRAYIEGSEQKETFKDMYNNMKC